MDEALVLSGRALDLIRMGRPATWAGSCSMPVVTTKLFVELRSVVAVHPDDAYACLSSKCVPGPKLVTRRNLPGVL